MKTTRRRVVCRSAVLAVAFSAVLATAPAAPAAAAGEGSRGPELHSFAAAFLYSQAHPDAVPPGANDWSCTPSADRPRPVVLVHGTWENRYNNFARLSPALRRAGFCVFALNYGDDGSAAVNLAPGIKGYGDIRASAGELATFVDRVRAATGSSEVDIVGHSQGGLMPRWYLRFGGGAEAVRTLVTLGATHHGTTLSGLGTLVDRLGLLPHTPAVLGEAARQQYAGSEFLRTLNQGGDTVAGVDYVVIATRYDQVTTPYESTFLTAGPGATVRNVTIQDHCAIDFSDHLSMSYSTAAIALVLRGLGVTGPLRECAPALPVV
ncbi:triacylglycerol esterase/lipase EstA (alpha/beta hydrolase family) [Prauserella shujinwangii]|uniref:Triacylglycerol esterase/lipase EstA (Alpha/beta hydrolase family) n=1 Tax=Prauserella shujinwangii TaxID=1453103 RepID=A0A2T0LL44_9PSEU|nr:alpha/beta fold hydrolase [Prauserella shujinwangii]PRX43668.1 triacylglycerol esterase/lipase EstA (alpha/beta hydrolase family) [Prauserella shujinwangii]